MSKTRAASSQDFNNGPILRMVGLLAALFALWVFVAPSSRSQRLPSSVTSAPGPAVTTSVATIQARAKSVFAQLPLRFEKNEGQADPQVKFMSQNGAYSLFFTPKEAVLLLRRKSPRKAASKSNQNAAVVRLRFVGSNANPRVVGVEEFPGKTNHFVGNDPKMWHTNVSNYARVKYEKVYPGVDLEYYGNQGGLEYDFTVTPGADANQIRFEVVGEPSSAPLLRLAPNGDLIVKTSGEEVCINKPIVYQPDDVEAVHTSLGAAKSDFKKEVSGHFVVEANNRVAFDLGPYDHSKRLVIDPAITYSTYLGGSYSSLGSSVAVYSDPATGHVYAYVAGGTSDTDFPTKNAMQASGGGDAFIAKIDPSASVAESLVWSTYLGGSDNGEFAHAITVDSAGNVYLTGDTNSSNFPTVNAYQSARKSPPNSYYPGTTADAFVSKLSADGSTLLYSTYFGGSGAENVHAIALDSADRVYIAGQTKSTDLPTVNPFQATLRATGGAAFLATFDTMHSGPGSLVYSTYLGGSGTHVGTEYLGDSAFGLAVDAAFGVHLGGGTTSPDFPIANGFQNNFLGGMSFYAKLNPFAPSSSQLVYSTFLGGAGGSGGLGGVTGIAVDSAGNAFLAGDAGPGQVPVTPGAYAAPTNPGDVVAFVAKINPALSGSASLIYCASLSLPQGGGAALATGIAVDATGNAFIVGHAGPGLSLVNPVQNSSNGVFQSLDAGSTWTGLTKGIVTNNIWALAIDTSTSPRTIYAGTADGNIYATTDGGLNWIQRVQLPDSSFGNPCTGSNSSCVFILIIDPSVPSTVYAGTSNGVYKSVDRGVNWSAFNDGFSELALQFVRDLKFDSGALYAATSGGLYKLANGATTWTQTSLTSNVTAVAIDPATNPRTFYVMSDFTFLSQKSVDGGISWAPYEVVTTNTANQGLTYLVVDTTTNPSSLYGEGAFGPELIKSSDGGTTWYGLPLYELAEAGFTDTYPAQTIVLDTSRNPPIIYVRQGGRVKTSFDGGYTWIDPVPNGSLHAIAIDPTTATSFSPAVLYAATDNPELKGFVVELDSSGSALLFATYLGGILGSEATLGNGIAVDAAGNIYVTGVTNSYQFPAVNAFQAHVASASTTSSAFFTKIGTQALPLTSPGPISTQVAVPIGTLTVSLPNVTGSTTSSAPTLSVTPLSSSDTADFSLSNNLGAYDISTTATYSGAVTLCFQAQTVNDLATFSNLQLIHIVDGSAISITSSHDFSTRTVCGSATSLSPFVLFNPTTNTALNASANPSVSGQPVTFAATVTSSGSPTGNVTFSDGATVLASIPLTSGGASFSTSSLAVGSHSITATFSGDGRWNGSTSSIVSQVVNRAATSITVSTSGSPSIDNQGVTVAATVTVLTPGLGTPTGSVTFKDGSTTFGTGALNNGRVTFTTSALGVGTHSITAVYAGDLNFAGSASTPAIQQVQYEPGGTTCLGAPAHQILQPINADGTSVWKQGRVIPAQFRVCDANGVSIGTAGVISSFSLSQIISGTITNVDETVSSTTTDAGFHWDATNQEWIFNISTKSLAANNTYVYTIGLNDGTTIVFKYGLK
jgi:hypothetical protein